MTFFGREQAKAELDLQQAQVEWDKQLLEKNRVIQEGAHERDADSLRHQMGDLEQLSRLKAENEILMKTQEDLRCRSITLTPMLPDS